MKAHFLLFLAGLLVCQLANAAAPNLVNYQGRLTDSAGVPVSTGNYSVTFSIYSVASGGAALWSETQNLTVTDGLFATLLGSVVPFTSNAFSDTIRYLGVQLAGNPEQSPRSRIASVPFAISAGNSGGWVDDGFNVHLASPTDRVGIGVSAPPVAQLQVHDAINWINGSRVSLTQDSTGAGTFDGFSLIYGSRTAFMWQYEIGPMLFGTSNAERMRIDNLGRIGIGTTNPQSPFVVQGSSSWGVAEIVGLGANSEASIGFRPSNRAKGDSTTWILGVNNNAGVTGAFSLYRPNGFGTGSQAISVLTNGHVGIGTAVPMGALDVSSTTGALIVPRMTTGQRDALNAVTGMIIYNTTTNQFNFRENGVWVTKP